ncbi:hypothetical protein Q9966_004634 [Columba livia]|nr:hypothetical protein Q9966_004634 [Columba livia]
MGTEPPLRCTWFTTTRICTRTRGEAQHHAGGLAVLGVLLEVGADPHPAYDNVLRHLGSIRYAGQTAAIPSFSIAALLPPRLDLFLPLQRVPHHPPPATRVSSGPCSSSLSTSAGHSWSSSREPFTPRRQPNPNPGAWWIIFGPPRSSTSAWCCRPSPGDPKGIRQVKSLPSSWAPSLAASASSSSATLRPRGCGPGGPMTTTSSSKPLPAAPPPDDTPRP